MCCLSGIAGSIFRKEEIASSHLLLFGAIRGTDSTGVAVIPRGKKDWPRVVKEVGNPFNVIDRKEYDWAFSGCSAKVVMNHNRAATRGTITRANAHPFAFENIVGTHNGTLWAGSDKALRKKIKDDHKYDTDSEMIFANLQVYPDVEETIKELEGAWALVWWDQRNDTINFLRNHDRPLFYTFDESRKLLFWASVPEMLLLTLSQNGIKRPIDEVTKKAKLITSLTPNVLISWKIPDINQEFSTEPTIRKSLEGKKLYAVVGNGYSYGSTSWAQGKHWNWETNQYEYPTDFDLQTGEEIVREGWVEVSDNYWKYKPDKEPKVIPLIRRTSTDQGILRLNHSTYQMESTQETNSVTEGQLKSGIEIESEMRDNKDTICIWRTTDNKVFWDKKNKIWIVCKWNKDQGSWLTERIKTPPINIPLTTLKWESGGDHHFSYQKAKIKGKKETLVYYKAFRGNLYAPSKFEECTSGGCTGCGRSDIKWGNIANFVSPAGDFLCEYCSRDEDTLKALVK